MKRTAPKKDVAAYLAAVPPKDRACLQRLRKTIRAAAPKAEERIGYGIPGYYQSGPVVYFAAFRDHLSFFAGYAVPKVFAKDFAAFKIKGTTVHFTAAKPLPTALVKKVVLYRLAQNLARVKKKRLKEAK
jgi:uncharacterized protein YdhG (YjbR/CyaY superfamily)